MITLGLTVSTKLSKKSISSKLPQSRILFSKIWTKIDWQIPSTSNLQTLKHLLEVAVSTQLLILTKRLRKLMRIDFSIRNLQKTSRKFKSLKPINQNLRLNKNLHSKACYNLQLKTDLWSWVKFCKRSVKMTSMKTGLKIKSKMESFLNNSIKSCSWSKPRTRKWKWQKTIKPLMEYLISINKSQRHRLSNRKRRRHQKASTIIKWISPSF